MGNELNRKSASELTVLAGIFFAAILSVFVNPNQNDLAHAIGMVSSDGGMYFHPVEYPLDGALFDKFTLFLTASVIPPVSGDFEVTLSGPEELDYLVSSRYPPGVPITNRADPWYEITADGTLLDVTPGSDLVVIMKISPPSEPGIYTLTLFDKNTHQEYFSMPVYFLAPGTTVEDLECH